MAPNAATSADSDGRLARAFPDSARHVGQLLALGAIAGIAAIMVTFLLLYWLRRFPLWAPAYGIFMASATTVDSVLGINVFRHPFMWHSIATGVFIGIAAPLIGTYLVHREMALIGETLAHTAFAGVAFGIVAVAITGLDVPLLLAALVVAVLGALGVQWLAERTQTYGDVPIAIMLSGSFAVATLLISYGRGMTGVNIEGYLFGSLAIVTVEGARTMAILTVLVVVVIAFTYKQLLFITFDEQAARVAHLHVDRYNTLLIVLTAVVVVGAMQVMGVILVAAMLVVPVAAATQVADSFRETIYLAIIFGELAIIGGFTLSIYFGLPSGGSIVVVAIALYLLAIGLGGRTTPITVNR